jgi:beta-1,4-mannosyltransferase
MRKIKGRRMKLVIDWHNYGYSILRVNGRNKILVLLGKLYEMWLGRFGDYHLCVSKAMQKDLMNKFNLRNVFVLYDKATKKF